MDLIDKSSIPFPAYRGTEPYIFVSYAHANAGEVFPLIRQFHDQGYHVWYDEGIAPGNEWTDEIANALENASLFLVFLTPESEASLNCRDEINFALNDNKPFLAIHLKETNLTGGLKLRVGTKQAILKYNLTDEEFLYKYTFAFEHLGLPVPEAIRQYKERTSPSAAADAVTAAKTVPAAAPSPAATAPAAYYTFRPKGIAVIRTQDDSFEVPANSIFSMANTSVAEGLKFRTDSDNAKMPPLSQIAGVEMSPHPDGNEFHRLFRITKTDGSVLDTDVQTSFAYAAFYDGSQSRRFPWMEVDSIAIDWSKNCLDDWGRFARIHMRGGDVVYVPAFTLTIATRKKPDANTLSFNRMLSWPETIRTERGFAVDFKDLSSLSFGQVSFTEDRWAKDWIGELPLGITLKDGRQLRTYAAMDYLLLFAMDDFGVVEMTPDKIARIDFVNDIAEEVFHCDPPGPR